MKRIDVVRKPIEKRDYLRRSASLNDVSKHINENVIIYENDKIGYLFIDSYIEKNTKYEWDNGTNNVGFKSIYFPKVTSKCF